MSKHSDKVEIIEAVIRGQKLVQKEMEKSYVMPLDAAYKLIGQLEQQRDGLLCALTIARGVIIKNSASNYSVADNLLLIEKAIEFAGVK